jgi:hypothetical protein
MWKGIAKPPISEIPSLRSGSPLGGFAHAMQGRGKKQQKTIVRWSVILAIAAAHFIVGFFALLTSFGASMSRFGSPSPSPVTWGEELMETLTTVLHFPIVTFWPVPAPGVFGYLVFALNSILWAVCIYAVSRLLLQRVRRV